MVGDLLILQSKKYFVAGGHLFVDRYYKKPIFSTFCLLEQLISVLSDPVKIPYSILLANYYAIIASALITAFDDVPCV
ncbi:hypothetical protein [Mucilaginibacter defluvii]|uniref:Uncharacterized protein n=1 Tax=Mucilaginibacter defluvii TaxID=1196019 RepID=A0ABP9FUT1_9SPHI